MQCLRTLLLVTFCATLAAGCEVDRLGVTYGQITHDGLDRSYRLFVPPTLVKQEAVPLLVALHGGGGTGQQFGRKSGLDSTAFENGFIVVYPDAYGRNWNDGRNDPNLDAQRNNIDDVGFIRALVEHLAATLPIDTTRLYVTGPSNGGMMTLRLSCEASDLFAAAAPVIANMPSELTPVCMPANPMPIQFIAGVDDPLMPWGGGNITVFGESRGVVDSIEDSVAFWAQHNACDAPTADTYLPDVDPNDGTRVWVRQYLNGTDGAEVVLYGIDGGGHDWPGRDNTAFRERRTGNNSHDIDANEVVWAFLSRFQR